MRIAVIADTHNRLPATLPGLIQDADEIWHLGDVCAEETLAPIEAIGKPLLIVRGNCDEDGQWPLELRLEREGRRILLTHIPPRVPPAGTDLLLHGHTHVPRNEVIAGCRYLNPGCITRPNRGAPPSFAWLELSPDRALIWTLHVLR